MSGRATDVDEWMAHPNQEGLGETGSPDGTWATMMCRVAKFHAKHDFAHPDNNPEKTLSYSNYWP